MRPCPNFALIRYAEEAPRMAEKSMPNSKDRVPQSTGPGSGIIVVVGVVAIVSMIFGFLLGLLF
jgi:hypothetical protein